MRQSTVLFGALLFAFIVYITLRGQLDDYLALFSSAPSPSASAGNADKTSTSSGSLGEFEKYFPKDLIKNMGDIFSNMGL